MITPEFARNLSAVHEAGHFVVAEKLNQKIIFATVKYKNRGGVVFSSGEGLERIDYCTRKLAGLAAEKIKYPNIRSNAAELDLEAVRDFSHGMWRVALKNAERILRSNRIRFEQVTDALLLHGSINGMLSPATPEDFQEAESIVAEEEFRQ